MPSEVIDSEIGTADEARYHGVLITYRRADDLRRSLDVLAAQTCALDTLVVVDNDADPAVAELVESHSNSAGAVTYLPTSENMGPAGGIHAGVGFVLAHASERDWIVLLDDDDPPQRDNCFEVLRTLLDAERRQDPSCVGIGLWGATLDGRSGRVRAAMGVAPEAVSYLPGGSCPHYSVGALRRTGAPPPDMFFGFDDLELGLRLRDAGYTLYSSGVAREHGLAHMVEGRRAAARSEPPTWRRYYSLRNLIIVLRSHGEIRGAIVMTIGAGFAKPMLNLFRRPRVAWANLVMNARAVRDGWLGRSGKTIDPHA